MAGKIILHLDEAMAREKVSLNQLAEQVGITNVNLSKMKNNRVTAVRFSTLAALCAALRCQPGDLLSFEPEEGGCAGRS